MTYLQRAGGSAAGIFSGLKARGDDSATWVSGVDDNPVFVGEYTHTGYIGEYTHMGDAAKVRAAKDALFDALMNLSASQFTSASANQAAFAKTFGLSSDFAVTFLRAAKARKGASSGGGGGGSDGGGGNGLFGTGLSPTMVIGGVAVLGVLGFAASRLGGGAARSNPGGRRRRRRRQRR